MYMLSNPTLYDDGLDIKQASQVNQTRMQKNKMFRIIDIYDIIKIMTMMMTCVWDEKSAWHNVFYNNGIAAAVWWV